MGFLPWIWLMLLTLSTPWDDMIWGLALNLADVTDLKESMG